MVWRGNSIAEIPRLEVMEAEVYVLEADAGGLEVDLPAKVSLEAHPGRVYDATIKKVDALAQPRFRNVPVQYFGVELELERTEPEVMKPGQRVNATLLLGERKDVVAVPRQAIFEHEGRTVVYARREGDFAPLEVELGPASLGRVVIESGLEQGERVALFDPTRPEREPATEEAEGESGPAGGLAGSLR
jgi:multidrug efflux pump subunit AcrA (membrane-fusion protein)